MPPWKPAASSWHQSANTSLDHWKGNENDTSSTSKRTRSKRKPGVARVDMKFEIVVIPSRMSIARRNSTGGSGGARRRLRTTVPTSA